MTPAPTSNRPPGPRQRPRTRNETSTLLARSTIAGTTRDRDRSEWLPRNDKKIYGSEVWPALMKEAGIVAACDNTAHMPQLPPQPALHYLSDFRHTVWCVKKLE